MPLTCSGGACPRAVGSRGDIVSLQVGSDDSTTGWTHPDCSASREREGGGSGPTQQRGRLRPDGAAWTAPPGAQHERAATKLLWTCAAPATALGVGRVDHGGPGGKQFGGFHLRFLFNEKKKHHELCPVDPSEAGYDRDGVPGWDQLETHVEENKGPRA